MLLSHLILQVWLFVQYVLQVSIQEHRLSYIFLFFLCTSSQVHIDIKYNVTRSYYVNAAQTYKPTVIL